MMLLARKGDVAYWSSDNWTRHRKDRQMWCSDIVADMLTEGLVATGYSDGNEGISEAAAAASNATTKRHHTPHKLTSGVALIRGLRLLQSMAGDSPDWRTKLGGHHIPGHIEGLLQAVFTSVNTAYHQLPRPPWWDHGKPGVPWGPQTTAGHATTVRYRSGDPMFVGEHGDLLWKALTETTQTGRSPLKAFCSTSDQVYGQSTAEMCVAAMLYDETAETQLTTDLFVGVEPEKRNYGQRNYKDRNVLTQRNVLRMLHSQAARRNSDDPSDSWWTETQHNRILGFIDVVEALKP